MQKVTCRKCNATYEPDVMNDFYQDDKAGPGTGLCERCLMNEAFNSDPVPINDNEHIKKVCKMGKGRECCIFLVVTPTNGGAVLSCAKGSGLNNLLVQKAKAGQMASRSINCQGPEGNFELIVPPFDYDNLPTL